ncbi:MAG TPA: hypothetical protein VFZ58_00165 [Candidatus Saccharimonadales bacterium]
MGDKSLEQFYENVVLPRYAGEVDLDKITWIDHGKVDLDAWAHYFRSGGKEYVLLYEDFPGNVYLDGLSHDLIKSGKETSVKLGYKDNENFEIVNVLGWFTLFREKSGN